MGKTKRKRKQRKKEKEAMKPRWMNQRTEEKLQLELIAQFDTSQLHFTAKLLNLERKK